MRAAALVLYGLLGAIAVCRFIESKWRAWALCFVFYVLAGLQLYRAGMAGGGRITLLTIPLGRHGLGGRGFAVLTAGFGLGQMLGPLIAGFLVAGDGNYDMALAGSAAVLGIGLVALAVAIRMRPATA